MFSSCFEISSSIPICLINSEFFSNSLTNSSFNLEELVYHLPHNAGVEIVEK